MGSTEIPQENYGNYQNDSSIDECRFYDTVDEEDNLALIPETIFELESRIAQIKQNMEDNSLTIKELKSKLAGFGTVLA